MAEQTLMTVQVKPLTPITFQATCKCSKIKFDVKMKDDWTNLQKCPVCETLYITRQIVK